MQGPLRVGSPPVSVQPLKIASRRRMLQSWGSISQVGLQAGMHYSSCGGLLGLITSGQNRLSKLGLWRAL